MSEVKFMAVSQWDVIPVEAQEAIATGQISTIDKIIGHKAVSFTGIDEPSVIKPECPDPYINDLGVFKVKPQF